MLLAICDNEKEELDRLLAGVQAYQEAGHDIAWRCFSDPAALLDELKQGALFDAALLDIIMPGVSGIALGRYILEHRPEMPVIYATTSRDFALQAFENHAIRYLIKPVQQSELFSALDMARSLTESHRETIAIRSSEGVVTVCPEHIVAVENAARAVRYIMADGSSVQTLSKRGKLDETIAPLPERPEFIKPHNSFWVNMNYIHALQKESMILDNGMQIPISRNRLTEVKHRYLKFLDTQGGCL